MKAIVALFQELDQAKAAIRALEAEGLGGERLSVEAKRIIGGRRPPDEAETMIGEGAGAGAAIGALIGLGVGLLAGLDALTLPGIGTVVAAGPLLAALTGAGLGGTAGALVGGLIGLGVPRGAAERYAERIREGRALVLVRGEDEAELGRAAALLERHDPVGLEEKPGSAAL